MNQWLQFAARSACWPIVLLAVSMTGCGASDGVDRASVSGTVTLDGQPVGEGSIVFTPTAGTTGPMCFVPIANGAYSIAAGDRGPVVGKHKVEIEGYRDTGTVDDGGAALKDQIVPAKYNRQTTLVVEVAKGSNTHNFELVSE
ncbi:MAG: hypothetical protein KJ000_14605 [Pirellulaceae bacterium]|nr:hypothetical protein [Pirellulaceae bacterium]